MKTVEYYRKPTPQEIKFGEGTTHYLTVNVSDVMRRDGYLKSSFIHRDGLRYRRDSAYCGKRGITPVVFRKLGDGGEIIALFPDMIWNGRDITSYMHLGQTCGADYDIIISKTLPATSEEYSELLHELETGPCKDLILSVYKKKRPKFKL